MIIDKMSPKECKRLLTGMSKALPEEEAKELLLLWSYSKEEVTDTTKLNTECGFEKLIGLEHVKKELQEQISFFQLQKIARMRGRKLENICDNLIFVGNPGTAKTTTAKIYSELLYKTHVISRPVFIEASRAELVSKYVGHTAKNVKYIVKQALGGVLFIDEAYSLVESDNNDCFGDEAVSTLIQEMERYRGQLCVILAGYPEEMRAFLDSNPGLKSRFNRIISFDDYTPNQLYQIAERIANENCFMLGSDVKEKIIPIFEKAMLSKNFGNGRFSRSIVEQAMLKKATSLTKQHNSLKFLSNDELFVLTANDFSEPISLDKIGVKQFGFGV